MNFKHFADTDTPQIELYPAEVDETRDLDEDTLLGWRLLESGFRRNEGGVGMAIWRAVAPPRPLDSRLRGNDVRGVRE